MPSLLNGPPAHDAYKKELISRLENLSADDELLNEWELGFVDDCLQRVQKGYKLTNKQLEKIEDIEADLPFRNDYDRKHEFDYGDDCIF